MFQILSLIYVLHSVLGFRSFEAHDDFRKRETNENDEAQPQTSMLACYIYSDASVSERLSQGGKPPSEQDYVAELEEKLEKLEKTIEGGK
jgi:hypothetical protein